MSKCTRQNGLTMERLFARMYREARPFDDLSEPARRGRRDAPFLQWCRIYLPHYFDRPFAAFHRRMMAAVSEPGMPTFVGAFRGAGKSVLLALARPLWLVLRGECPYFIFASQVQKLAAQSMSYLRLELEHNLRIRCDYGKIVPAGSEEEWTVRPDGVAPARLRPRLRPAKFEAFGIGMSPRGRRFRQWRPLEFVGDDLETTELARNPEREQNLWDWMMDEVMPALEPQKFRFTVLGTTFGPGCMLERAGELAAKSDSRGRPLARLFLQRATYGPTDDAGLEGRSVWPERFTDAVLQRIRRTIGLRNWLRNYALVAEDPSRPFQPSWMGSYEPADADPQALDVVCFLDPAVSQSATSCPRALVCVGADRATGRRFVLDAWIERRSALETLDRLIAFHRRWRPRLIGIEQNGGYALIRPLLRMRAGGALLPVRYVHHTQAKEIRIERLSPQFEAGLWLFPRDPGPGVRTLQEQFLSYPRGFVDGPDAAAGCDELLPDPFQSGPEFRYAPLSGRTDFTHL